MLSRRPGLSTAASPTPAAACGRSIFVDRFPVIICPVAAYEVRVEDGAARADDGDLSGGAGRTDWRFDSDFPTSLGPNIVGPCRPTHPAAIVSW